MSDDNALTPEERADVEALPGRQPGCPDPTCSVCKANARRGAALAKLLRIHDATVSHPGDGSCERCGVAPVVDGLCPECTCTSEERAVLDAIGAEDHETLDFIARDVHATGEARAWAKAELANRAAKADRVRRG
jgi:hypothetical protein